MHHCYLDKCGNMNPPLPSAAMTTSQCSESQPTGASQSKEASVPAVVGVGSGRSAQMHMPSGPASLYAPTWHITTGSPRQQESILSTACEVMGQCSASQRPQSAPEPNRKQFNIPGHSCPTSGPLPCSTALLQQGGSDALVGQRNAPPIPFEPQHRGTHLALATQAPLMPSSTSSK
jgi:hypothetical protein